MENRDSKLIKSKIPQKTEEGFQPTEKSESNSRSKNFRTNKSGFKKRQAAKKGKSNFKKSDAGSKNKQNQNRKKGSKAKTRWKKGKGS